MAETPNPAETDRALVDSLLLRHGVALKIEAHQVTARLATKAPHLKDAEREIVAAMRPASVAQISTALFVLAKLTNKYEGGADEAEGAAELNAWIEKLRGYPADVVMHVLNWWPDRHGWPKWHELKAALDDAARDRRRMLIAVGKPIDEPAVDDPDEPSEEERQRIAAIHARTIAALGGRAPNPHATAKPKARTLLEQRMALAEEADREQRLRALHPDLNQGADK